MILTHFKEFLALALMVHLANNKSRSKETIIINTQTAYDSCKVNFNTSRKHQITFFWPTEQRLKICLAYLENTLSIQLSQYLTKKLKNDNLVNIKNDIITALSNFNNKEQNIFHQYLRDCLTISFNMINYTLPQLKFEFAAENSTLFQVSNSDILYYKLAMDSSPVNLGFIMSEHFIDFYEQIKATMSPRDQIIKSIYEI